MTREEKGFLLWFIIFASVQLLYDLEEGIQNFPVKLSVELHISEAWKVILPLNKWSGNGNFEEMETTRI